MQIGVLTLARSTGAIMALLCLGGPTTQLMSAAAQTTTCNDGQRRFLDVQNLTQSAIMFIQHRPSFSAANFGADVLGSAYIPPGSTVIIGMPSANCQCRADIRVTLDANGTAGRTLDYPNQNYCSARNGNNPLIIVD